MNQYELIATIVTAVGVVSFATIFTVLYRIYANSAVAEYESGKCDVDLIEETILYNAQNKSHYRRVFRRVKQVLLCVFVALLIPLICISLYSKITSGIAMINGRGMIAVASGSMSEQNAANPYLQQNGLDNQFDTYDMIFLEKVDSASELRLYDVIAFVNDEGVNVIHRIVGFQGNAYITRGDSNNADDQYHPTFDDVLGRYTNQRVPYVGIFVMFLQSYSGIVTVLAVIYCLFMIEGVGNKLFDAREARLSILQESIDFKSDVVRDESLDASFVETVYFKDYAYTFDENGFVSKTLRTESSDTQKSNPDPAVTTDPKDVPHGNGDGE
ncbi:MAG: signal peptidase I [Clostridia bacterium]|nr:signal peptidase I [Clostridia bacterium]